MNDAVYKFKRYEDASLIYTGIDKHTGENVGLYSTVISREDYDAMAGQLADSMKADAQRDDDLPERPRFIKEAGADNAVLQLKSLEAFQAAANGKANKIIIPSDIQGIAGLVKSIAEVASKDEAVE